MDIGAESGFLTDRAAVRRRQQAGSKGLIVNTASMAGKTGAPLPAHDTAGKFAVVGFTPSPAQEVGAAGIRRELPCAPAMCGPPCRTACWCGRRASRNMPVAAVRAEYVALTPPGRIEESEEVADVVVFLASDLGRFMTGEAVCVTGEAWMH